MRGVDLQFLIAHMLVRALVSHVCCLGTALWLQRCQAGGSTMGCRSGGLVTAWLLALLALRCKREFTALP